MEIDRKEYIDIHTHWLMFGTDSAVVLEELERIEASGFEAVAMFPMPGMGVSPEKVMDLIPGFLRKPMALDIKSAAHDDLESWWKFQRRWLMCPRTLQLLSFLDVRAWDGQIDLAPWWGKGHAGLKGILIEEGDYAKMAMSPLRRTRGLSLAAYREAQRAVFTAAERYGVPLVYHADLNLHGEFVAECLQEHPHLRVNIPHCGLSRRAMGNLLDRFPALVTDISSLGPHITANPASYRAFILDYADRVMLGSDALASIDLRPVLGYVDHVRGLSLPEEVEKAVLGGNARHFLTGDTTR
ncbi:MAG: amidohydrolase family protein [Desulfobacterales bacterium]|nr:amidohydrolase family protein [Desulfobacterales bacterium]